MNRRCGVWVLVLSLLQVHAALAAKENVVVRAYVNDTCVVADEPYYLPAPPPQEGEQAAAPKFLPLLGLVIGKLAELFINHEIQASASHYKSGVARKDTHYAVTSVMNLYRADFEPAPTLSINARLGCMTIVAGSFKPENIDCRAAYVPKELSRDSIGKPEEDWKTSRTDDSIENPLRRANICIEGKVRALYEARFEFSTDGTAYRLKDAGYRIDTLLTTEKAGAARSALYTLKISNPSPTDQQEILSSAWVNIGSVTAGARSRGKPDSAAPWLRVPPLSVEARRIYEQKTRTQQDTAGEIQALQRALTRNQRVLANLDQRIGAAPADFVEGLKQERTRIAVQQQTQSAELDARKAEYHELPLAPLEFMPVSIEVAVTETESEKKAQLALAEIVGSNSDLVASAVGNAATGLISKGVAAGDLKLDSEPVAADYDEARARYFDALIAVKAEPAAGVATTQRSLMDAKSKYNQARHSLGLEPIS